jgi:hypothetical protein
MWTRHPDRALQFVVRRLSFALGCGCQAQDGLGQMPRLAFVPSRAGDAAICCVMCDSKTNSD